MFNESPKKFQPYLVDSRHSRKNERLGTIQTPDSILEKGAVSNDAIADTLSEQDLTFDGSREILSSGALGPIYRINAKTPSGETISVVEKVFGRQDKRFMTIKADSLESASVKTRPRLGIVDNNSDSGQLQEAVIDWLFNEELALKNLKDIPGIPKSYGAVYEGKRGSILEQFVDGYDMMDTAEKATSLKEINEIFDRYEQTYTEAAKAGYIYNNPYGATAMVDTQTKQPYLMDWYQHGTGSIESEGPVKEKYLNGLRQIRDFRSDTIDAWSQAEAEKIKKQIQTTV